MFRCTVWIAVVVLGIAAVRSNRAAGVRGSAALGGISGLADSGLALSARAINIDSHHLVGLLYEPLALALVPFAVIGVVTFAAALQRGAASVALAGQQGVVTVVPSAIGLMVLGDSTRPGFFPLTIVAFVVTISTLVVLTVSTARRRDVVLLPTDGVPAEAPGTADRRSSLEAASHGAPR